MLWKATKTATVAISQSKAYVSMVVRAGGRVRGFTEEKISTRNR